MADLLRMDYINSMPQPFYVRLLGDKEIQWPVESICVETGCARIDVCGMLHVVRVSDFSFMMTADGDEVDIESLYCDYLEDSE